MKIYFERKNTAFEFQTEPMSEGRFRALCALVLAVICGGVLLGLVHMLGVWGIVWSLGGLVAVFAYRLILRGDID